MRPRSTRLEPVGRYAIVVTFVHGMIGLGIWAWLQSHSNDIQESPGKDIAWMSPADFSVSVEAQRSPAVETLKSNEPTPAPVIAVETPVEPKPAVEDDSALPKAIAIDPAKAAEIMAKAIAVEKSSKPVQDPTPPKLEAKSIAEVPPPAQPATDAGRVISVSHPLNAPATEAAKSASLLEVAALDAKGTGTSGDKTGIRLDEIDRAIIDAFLRNWTPPNANKLPLDQRNAHMDVTVNREGRLVRFKLAKTSGSKELDDSVVEAGNRLDNIGALLPGAYPHDLYEFQVNFHVE